MSIRIFTIKLPERIVIVKNKSGKRYFIIFPSLQNGQIQYNFYFPFYIAALHYGVYELKSHQQEL